MTPDEFQEIRRKIRTQINKHKDLISMLMKELNKSRPKTDNGDLQCSFCGCISLAFVEEDKNGEKYYKCEVPGCNGYCII